MGLMAQCDELFISEYVEGTNNNKALEIYNPTSEPVNLSEYSITRLRNGDTPDNDSNNGPLLQLPNMMLEPYRTFVVVIDKQNMNGAGQEAPVWNGYNVIEIGIDSLTGEPEIASCGEPEIYAQYEGGDNQAPFVFGDTYYPEYDLAGKADIFVCPEYQINSRFYFNGNDAILLVKGTEIALDGSNLIDVIGVIGEDPEVTIEQPAWVDANGKWITRDITITRRADILAGTGLVVLALGDTMAYSEWDYHCRNEFINLGSHGCDCDPDFVNIDEVVNQIPVNLQPNPTDQWLMVNAPQAIQHIEIYDLAGRQVFQQNYTNFNTQIRLNVHDYQSGMYVVNVIFEDNQRTAKKFVVK